jgi:hypothetical protein
MGGDDRGYLEVHRRAGGRGALRYGDSDSMWGAGDRDRNMVRPGVDQEMNFWVVLGVLCGALTIGVLVMIFWLHIIHKDSLR